MTFSTSPANSPQPGADTREFMDYAQDHYDVAVWTWVSLGIQWMIARGPWGHGVPKWS